MHSTQIGYFLKRKSAPKIYVSSVVGVLAQYYVEGSGSASVYLSNFYLGDVFLGDVVFKWTFKSSWFTTLKK